MSRSYKKYPCVKDKNRGMKAFANRKVRRQSKEVADGNAYRRLVCSYDISDWAFHETYKEYCARADRYRKEYENGAVRWGLRVDISEEMSYWDWYKMYRRK